MSAAEIHEFFVEGTDRKQSHALLHISEPDASTPHKGAFFAVCDIKNAAAAQIAHMQTLIDDLESGYYETNDDHDQSAFEIALKYINKRASTIHDYPGSEIHCLVGVLHKRSLVFSGLGDAKALLFYPDGEGIGHTIVHEARAEDDAPQLFSSVTEGHLNTGDVMLFATPGVTQHFSGDRISKLLRSKSLEETQRHIQKTLGDIKSADSYSGIFIESKKTYSSKRNQEDALPETDDEHSVSSMSHLRAQERETARTLSPPVLTSLTGALKQGIAEDREKASEKRMQRAARRSGRKREESDELMAFALRAFVTGLRGLISGVLGTIFFIGRMLRALFLLATNLGGQRQTIIQGWHNWLHAQKRAIEELSLLSKIFFLLTLLFVLVFAGSLAYVRVVSNRDAKVAVYNAELDVIKTQVEEAEASLIYGNTEKAIEVLRSQEEAAKQFGEQSKEAEEDVQPILMNIRDILLDLRQVDLRTATALVDFGQESSVKPTRIAKVGNTIVAFAQDEDMHLTYDLQSKAIKEVSHDAIRPLVDASTPKEDDEIIFITEGAGLAQFDVQNQSISSRDVSFETETDALTDLFVYNERLYILSEEAETITRHSATQTGYDRGTAWLKEASSYIDGARAIAIDGDMYVLYANEVKKLSRGRAEDFSLGMIDPPLSNPTDLWTYNGLDELYILEPEQKRVLVMNKENGRLITQIAAEGMENPTSFVVDTDASLLYILDGSMLKSMSL